MAVRIFLSTNNTGLQDFKSAGELLRKDFIRVGEWRVNSPNGGFRFKVTPDRLEKWKKTFQLMRERGITVPLTVDHVQVRDPKTGVLLQEKLSAGKALAKRGEVRDVSVEGDCGMCDVMPADEDSKQLMQRCPEVSLELTKDFYDGHGNFYDEAITAVTLTPFPVVPGQQTQWRKVMASQEGQNSETVCLSADPSTEEEDSSQERSMDPELVKLLRKLFAIPEAVKDAEFAVHLSRCVDEQKVVILTSEAVAKMIGDATKEKEDRIVVLSRDLQTAKAENAGIPAVDEDAMDMAATAFETRIKALGFKATPQQKKLLLSAMVGEPGSRNVICLSRKAAKAVNLDAPLADTVLSIFEAGDPVEMQKLLAEQSGHQRRVELSRDNPDAGETYDPKITERMIARANDPAKTSSTVL